MGLAGQDTKWTRISYSQSSWGAVELRPSNGLSHQCRTRIHPYYHMTSNTTRPRAYMPYERLIIFSRLIQHFPLRKGHGYSDKDGFFVHQWFLERNYQILHLSGAELCHTSRRCPSLLSRFLCFWLSTSKPFSFPDLDWASDGPEVKPFLEWHVRVLVW